jgi:hypothetical protein
MATYYVDDPKLLILSLPGDLDDADEAVIVYRTPSGIEGLWEVVIDAEEETITATLDDGELDEAGEWIAQARVTMTDGLVYHSDLVSFYIRPRLTFIGA